MRAGGVRAWAHLRQVPRGHACEVVGALRGRRAGDGAARAGVFALWSERSQRAKLRDCEGRVNAAVSPHISAARWAEILEGSSRAVGCWDSLEAMRTCPGGVFDACIADPPYSSGGTTATARKHSTVKKYVSSDLRERREGFEGDARDQRSWQQWSERWMGEALRVVRKGGSLLVFTDWRQLSACVDAVQVAGWTLRGVIPWDKGEGGARPVEGGLRSGQCEFIVWGSHSDRKGANGVYLPGCFRLPVERGGERLHICQKPVRLCALLSQVAPRGGRVLDPFCGSGAVLEGAVREGRWALGLERLPKLVATSNGRLARLLSGGPLVSRDEAQGVLL